MAKPAHKATPPSRTICTLISSSPLSRLAVPKRKLEGLGKTLHLLPLAYWSPWTFSLGSESPGGAPASSQDSELGQPYRGPFHWSRACPPLPQPPFQQSRSHVLSSAVLANIPWESLLRKHGPKVQEAWEVEQRCLSQCPGAEPVLTTHC